MANLLKQRQNQQGLLATSIASSFRYAVLAKIVLAQYSGSWGLRVLKKVKKVKVS